MIFHVPPASMYLSFIFCLRSEFPSLPPPPPLTPSWEIGSEGMGEETNNSYVLVVQMGESFIIVPHWSQSIED